MEAQEFIADAAAGEVRGVPEGSQVADDGQCGGAGGDWICVKSHGQRVERGRARAGASAIHLAAGRNAR
jgi:hypothetical protein